MAKECNQLLADFYTRLAILALQRGQDTEAKRLFDIANRLIRDIIK